MEDIRKAARKADDDSLRGRKKRFPKRPAYQKMEGSKKDSSGQYAFDRVWARKGSYTGSGGAPLGTYRG